MIHAITGTAGPPTTPSPVFTGPLAEAIPPSAPALASAPTTAAHPSQGGKAVAVNDKAATATKNAVPAGAAGAATTNAAA